MTLKFLPSTSSTMRLTPRPLRWGNNSSSVHTQRSIASRKNDRRAALVPILRPIDHGRQAMVRIGIVGVGFMGRIHYLAAQRLKGAKVAAVCSRDPAKLSGDWRNTRGNFGPEPGKVDLSGVKKYSNVGE